MYSVLIFELSSSYQDVLQSEEIQRRFRGDSSKGEKTITLTPSTPGQVKTLPLICFSMEALRDDSPLQLLLATSEDLS